LCIFVENQVLIIGEAGDHMPVFMISPALETIYVSRLEIIIIPFKI
jgi:hypothetical protein